MNSLYQSAKLPTLRNVMTNKLVFSLLVVPKFTFASLSGGRTQPQENTATTTTPAPTTLNHLANNSTNTNTTATNNVVAPKNVPSRTPNAIFQELNRATSVAELYSLMESFKSLETMRGSVEFVESTLRRLDELDIDVDKTTYDKLLDIFPKGFQITRSWWDVVWPRASPQVDCVLGVLQRMEDDDICPDLETFKPLFYTFGKDSEPVRKCESMYHWFMTFGKLPSQLPPPLPQDKTLRAKYALERLLDIPNASVITQGSEKSPFLVTHSTSKQLELLKSEYSKSPLLVHGPHSNWYRRTYQPYYILTPRDEQDTILGYAMTDFHSQEMLDKWIIHLGCVEGSVLFQFTDLKSQVSDLYNKRQKKRLYGQLQKILVDQDIAWKEIEGVKKIESN